MKHMNSQEFRTIPILNSVADDALQRLAGVLETREFADGAPVFLEGERGDGMYFILSGGVRVQKRADVAGGTQKTLTVLQAGDYFGEMALFDDKPRSASAVASGPTKLLRLSKGAFEAMQQTSTVAATSVLFGMIRTSGDRIRRLSAQLVVYDEVGKALGEAGDLQHLLRTILEQLSLATSADWALAVLRSQFSDQLEIRGQVNLAVTAEQGEAIAKGEGFLKVALQDAQARRVDNFEDEEAFRSCPRLGFESPSLLLTPIVVGQQLLGLMVLGGRQQNQFDLDGLNLVRGVARQAGQAILNARHSEEEAARSRHSRHFVRF
jgi:CRP/FNR family transcriptional regulator